MRQHNGTLAAARSADGTAQALEEYLAAAEAGTAPPREQFLTRHPELADDLDACLAALHFIGRAAHGPRSVAADLEAAASPEQAPGQLGDFRLVREIGRGGMGVVYEAEQVSLGRRVALKVLPFAATMDPRQLQRFHNEARAAASLDHPHIVPVHAVGCERAVHFYAMQLIEGQTLAAFIADQRQRAGRPVAAEAQATTPHVPGQPAPAADTAERAATSTEGVPLGRDYFRRVAELGIQAAEALDHAHALGIVHRDVKPANLLVDARGGLWVTDFGLAHMQSDARLTMTGDLVGTLRYMSPEQALAKRVVVDHRTDVYSLGATLYELLTLEPAFGGGDRQELLRQIAFEEPRPPRRLNKAIPAELETVVLKALEKNPADRYATAKELTDDLRRFLADEPVRARRVGMARRLRKWGRRHPAWVAAAAAALTAAVAVLSGGIGWVANDRATRRKAAESGVASALEESRSWQEQGRLLESLSAADRAAGLAAGADAGPTLRRQVDARVAHLRLLDRLENVRLEHASACKDNPTEGSGFDQELADRLYGDAFAEAGLQIEAWSVQEAGERIRDTTVAAELAAVLDDWARVRRRAREPADLGWMHLLQVARAADPDAWRDRLRLALERQDGRSLAELAACEEALDLRPASVPFLAEALAAPQAVALLREMQRRHRNDFWANEELAILLMDARPTQAEEAIRFHTAALALRPRSPGAHLNLGILLQRKGRLDEAIAEFREALHIKGDYASAHVNLGHALCEKGDLDGGIAECREAIEIDPRYVPAHNGLGIALRDKKDLDGAIAEYKKALEINPRYVPAYINLGTALCDKKDLNGAIAQYRKAIDIDPENVNAHANLGLILRNNKDLDGAIAECRKAIALEPKHAAGHNNLGLALYDKGDLAGAVAEYRLAIDSDTGYAQAYTNLGMALFATKDSDGAVAAFRKAIALDDRDSLPHNELGIALGERNDLDGAIAEYRRAIEINPRFAEPHCNLGLDLVKQGRFTEARVAARRGLETLPEHDAVRPRLSRLLQRCERLIELDGKLPAVLSGQDPAGDASQRGKYAELCHLKHLYAAATRFYREAMMAQPRLVASPANGVRYNAACNAALAGCGAGEDAAKLTDAERAGLRKQALDWLQADLDAWRGLLDKDPAKVRPTIAETLQRWLHDPDFNGMRGADTLAKLPEAEREGWRTLWADVADTLAQARRKST